MFFSSSFMILSSFCLNKLTTFYVVISMTQSLCFPFRNRNADVAAPTSSSELLRPKTVSGSSGKPCSCADASCELWV